MLKIKVMDKIDLYPHIGYKYKVEMETSDKELVKLNKIRNKFLDDNFIDDFIDTVYKRIGFYNDVDKLYSYMRFDNLIGSNKFLDKPITTYLKKNVKFKGGELLWDFCIETEMDKENDSRLYVRSSRSVETSHKLRKLDLKYFTFYWDSSESETSEFGRLCFQLYCDETIYCDIKFILDEEYYSYLETGKDRIYSLEKQGISDGIYILFVEEFHSDTATKEQLKRLFYQNNIYVIFFDEIYV